MDHKFIFLLLFPVFPDDSEVGEAVAWKSYLLSQWPTKKKKTVFLKNCFAKEGMERKL